MSDARFDPLFSGSIGVRVGGVSTINTFVSRFPSQSPFHSSWLHPSPDHLKTLDEVLWAHTLERDLVDFLKEWVTPDSLSGQKEVVDLFGGGCSL